MSRAFNSGIRLSEKDASIVKGMLHRGDRQHDIASWFGVNSGRIAEISVRKKFANVLMTRDNLPPEGPYLTGKELFDAKNRILEQNEKLQNLLTKLDKSHLKDELQNIFNEINEIADEM